MSNFCTVLTCPEAYFTFENLVIFSVLSGCWLILIIIGIVKKVVYFLKKR